MRVIGSVIDAPPEDALHRRPRVAEKRMIMRSISVAYVGNAFETRTVSVPFVALDGSESWPACQASRLMRPPRAT